MSPGRPGVLIGEKIERKVGCGAAVYCHLPGGFESGLLLPLQAL